jgi:head-tail adaptor
MEAGRLDRRITLFAPSFTRDAMNQPVAGWSTGIRVSARKLDVSDSEQVRAQQAGAAISSRFHVRRCSEIAALDPTWQLDHEGQRFEIRGLKELLAHGDHGRRVGIEITASALIPAAPPPGDAS